MEITVGDQIENKTAVRIRTIERLLIEFIQTYSFCFTPAMKELQRQLEEELKTVNSDLNAFSDSTTSVTEAQHRALKRTETRISDLFDALRFKFYVLHPGPPHTGKRK